MGSLLSSHSVIYIELTFVKLWLGHDAKKSKHILALLLYVSVDFVFVHVHLSFMSASLQKIEETHTEKVKYISIQESIIACQASSTFSYNILGEI